MTEFHSQYPIKEMDGTTRYIDLHFKFTFTFTFCFDGFMKKRQFGKNNFEFICLFGEKVLLL